MRDERPAPVLLHDGFVIPGELCAELVQALEEYVLLLRGRPLPPGRRGAQLSRPALAVLLAARDGAVRHQAHLHTLRALAAPTPVTPVVLGAAQLGPVSDVEEITTVQAADRFGYTSEWWRSLAKRGTVPARRGERGTWLLQLPGVVAYTRQETRSADRDPDTARPARQAG
jgi:hypothetical protein